jgi:altronate dehydratase
MNNCVLLNEKDNVATTIAPIAAGAYLVAGDGLPLRVQAVEVIPVYHKVSVVDIPRGGQVRKYGQTIGRASADIPAGSHVHTQNLVSEVDYEGALR